MTSSFLDLIGLLYVFEILFNDTFKTGILIEIIFNKLIIHNENLLSNR